MKIKELAHLSGVSVRTLHHYDQIGLLTPGKREENGYREYQQQEIDKLQQILLFRACGFSLSAIHRIFFDPTFDEMEAFSLQKKLLLEEKKRIDCMLSTLEKTRKAKKEGKEMSNEDKFLGFDFSKDPYEQEAKKKWGEETVEQSKRKIESLGSLQQEKLKESLNEVFLKFAKLRAGDPAGEQAQAAAKELQDLFLLNIGEFYTKEVMGSLGEMYTGDVRFAQNIDQFGDGTAAFVGKVLEIYAK